MPGEDVEFEAVTGPTDVPEGNDETAVPPVLSDKGAL